MKIQKITNISFFNLQKLWRNKKKKNFSNYLKFSKTMEKTSKNLNGASIWFYGSVPTSMSILLFLSSNFPPSKLENDCSFIHVEAWLTQKPDRVWKALIPELSGWTISIFKCPDAFFHATRSDPLRSSDTAGPSRHLLVKAAKPNPPVTARELRRPLTPADWFDWGVQIPPPPPATTLKHRASWRWIWQRLMT